MGLSIFRSLPSYPGSKRRLLCHIFRHVPPPSQAPRFVDCFLGGGSVSLYAKGRGYEVQANDISLRSLVVGKALIENSVTRLAREDVLRLFLANDKAPKFVQERFSHQFLRRHCEFLDLAISNVKSVEGVKRYLLLLLVLKLMLRLRPMGNFGARKIIEQIQNGNWETTNQNFLSKSYVDRVSAHPLKLCQELRKQINGGIFSNGRTNTVSRMDVFTFLPSVRGDVLYADPPYMKTSSYESSLRVVDVILEGKERPIQRSVFSGKYALDAVEKMLSLATHIPRWVLSYGSQGGTELEDLVKLMRKFKKNVTGESVRYQHCPGLCSQEHKNKNREYIICGY